MGKLLLGNVFPDYVDIEGAWQEDLAMSIGGGGVFLQYNPQSGYLDVPISAACRFQTSAIAGNRGVFATAINNISSQSWFLSAANTQGPSQTGFYSFNKGLAAPWGPVAGLYAIPLPDIILYPGNTFFIECELNQPGDAFDNATITVLHVPTQGTDVEYQHPQPFLHTSVVV